MLLLVNKYGFSHVCAFPELKNIGDEMWGLPFNFPFLDIHLSYRMIRDRVYHPVPTIEFYYRGAKDRNLQWRNLFEHLLSTALIG